MSRLPSVIAMVSLAACYGPDHYRQDMVEARCALYEECGYLGYIGEDSYEGCVEAMMAGTYECGGYDRGAARTCVEGLDALSCENLAAGYYPEACLSVCKSTVKTTEE